MAGNTDRIQYRGSGDLGPRPWDLGRSSTPDRAGDPLQGRVARVIESASQKIHGAGGSWPRGLAGK